MLMLPAASDGGVATEVTSMRIPDQAMRTELLLRCGALGPLVFIAVFLVEGFTRPGYDPYHSMVSELALSSWGWQQIANFLLCGGAMLAGTIGLWRARTARLAAGVLTITALGMLLAGIFVTDPGLAYPADAPRALPEGAHTWHGLLHGLAGAIVFFSLPIATVIMAAWFGRRRQGRWLLYTLATLGVGFATFLISMADPAVPAGVFQRITIITYFTWLSMVLLHAANLQRQPHTAAQPVRLPPCNPIRV
jgi:hypothetical membrane protein